MTSDFWVAPRISRVTDNAGRFMCDHLRQGQWLMQAEGALGETVGEAIVYVLNNAMSEVTIEVASASVPTQPHQTDPDSSTYMPISFNGGIRGRVISTGDGRPISDATITVLSGAGQAADIAPMTDQYGWFVMDNLPVGRWRLRATTPDGAMGEAAVEVFENSLSEMTIEIRDADPTTRPPGRRGEERPEDPKGSLSGQVMRASDHQPVGQVTVTVISGPAPAPDLAPVTDRDGRFVLDDLVSGDWQLQADGLDGETGNATAHVEGGALSEVTILIARRDDDEVREVRNPPLVTANRRRRVVTRTGTVRGRVVRADTGKPVVDAAVTASGGPAAAPDIAPLSNADGLFFLDGLAPGRWQLSALGPRGETGQSSVTLEAGSIANIVIRVELPRQPRRR